MNLNLIKGLSLGQRINALLQLQTWLNEALRDRIECAQSAGSKCAENGSYIAHYLREESIKIIMREMKDSIVADFETKTESAK